MQLRLAAQTCSLDGALGSPAVSDAAAYIQAEGRERGNTPPSSLSVYSL